MFLGLGVPEWMLIIGLIGGLWVTFRVMARASVAYEKARKARGSGTRSDRLRSRIPENEKELTGKEETDP